MVRHKLVLNENSTFEDAVGLLDNAGTGIIAVVDKADKLIGIITDGDVRRAILSKNTNLDNLINKNPLTLSAKASKKEAVKFLKSVYRKHVPLVDADGVLKDIFVIDALEFNSKPNKVVIMAGGLGERLGEMTKKIPKPMLNVGQKPLMADTINSLYHYGFANIFMSVNYKSEIIKDYFKDGSHLGVNVTYLEEKKRLGTAGSLSLLKEPGDEPLLVINGDILTSINYEKLCDFHKSSNADVTICVKRYDHRVPYGVVNLDGGKISSFEEKPMKNYFINVGIYVISPKLISEIPKDVFYDMPMFFSDLLKKDYNLQSYTLDGYWLDIGHAHDYEKANMDFKYI